MNALHAPRRPLAALALIALACVIALALTSDPARAGTSVCKTCVEAGNDTAFTPGKSATPREYSNAALPPDIGFIGADRMLHCAMPAGTGWQIEGVAPFPIDGGCSIVVDDNGQPAIAAHDDLGTLFVFHRNAAGTWSYDPVDPSVRVTGTPSLARVPDGIGIAYCESVGGALKYAERTGPNAWIAEFVTSSGGGRASDPSLVADGAVRAIGFHDASAGDLLLAQRLAGSQWAIATVDTAGDVGGYASLLGGPSHGGWGIAYYDFTNANLKYAQSATAGWSIEIVDGASDRVGHFCAAVSFGGSPFDLVGIAYYDQTHGDLKYAQKHGGAWTVTVQDTAGDVGSAVACAASPLPLDAIGIVYVDRGAGDLLYQAHAGTVNAVPLAGETAPALHVEWLRAASGAGGRLRFSVPAAGPVRVTLFDAAGRLIASPLRQSLPAGPAEAGWDGRDTSGHRAHAGVVFARVETAGGAAAVPAVVLP